MVSQTEVNDSDDLVEEDLPAPLTDDETLSLIYTLADSVGIVVVGRSTADIRRVWRAEHLEEPTPAQIDAVRANRGFCGDHLIDAMLDATYDDLVRAIDDVKAVSQ